MKSKEILSEQERRSIKTLVVNKKCDYELGIKIDNVFSALFAAEEEIDEKTKLIDKLHYENQILIGENAQLKVAMREGQVFERKSLNPEFLKIIDGIQDSLNRK